MSLDSILIYADGEERGPYHWYQLISLVDTGICTWDDYAWCEGMEEWEPLHIVYHRLAANAPRPSERWKEEPESVSFFLQIALAFIYPLRGSGAWAVHLSGSFLLIAITIVSRVGIIGLVGSILLYGYYLTYLFRIVQETVGGEQLVTSFPGFGELWEDLFIPFVKMALVVLVCFLPFIGSLIFWPPTETNTIQFQHILLLILGVGGLFYLPMALLTTICFNSVRTGVNPLLVIPSIYRIFFRYLILVLIQGLIWGGFFAVTYYIRENLSFWALLLVFPIRFYFAIVQMRILGLIYYTNQDELGWFTHT